MLNYEEMSDLQINLLVVKVERDVAHYPHS